MTRLALPALAGPLVYGWLPAIGLTRLLSLTWPGVALSWDEQWGGAVLTDGPATPAEAAEAAHDHSIALIPDGGVLPAVDPGFPPAKARDGDPGSAEWTGDAGPLWQHTLVAPTGLHPLLRPHAAQTLRTMLSKPAALLRKHPELLAEALTGLGLTDRYSGGLWMLRRTVTAADSTTGAPGDSEASPGRDWLALMGLPWAPVYELAVDDEPPVVLAPGWRYRTGPDSESDDGPVLAWSLWTDPVPAAQLPELLRRQHEQPQHQHVARRVQRSSVTRHAPPTLAVEGTTSRGPGAPGAPDPDGLVAITARVYPWMLPRIDALAAEVDEPRDVIIRALIEGGLQANEMSQLGGALDRLLRYRQAHETLHDDIRQAVDGGATVTDVAGASGLSRPGIYKILGRADGANLTG